MDINFVVGIFVFITGLSIGSFLNVVVLRALSDESIVFPASKCPKCQTPLKWWHNIPVLSYIFLRGKCAFCKEKISIQYPIVELLTGYLFLSTFMKFGYSFNTIFVIIFLSMFIVISTTDIREHVAFNLHSYILAIAGLIYNFFNFGHLYNGYTWIFHTSFVYAILGLILGAALIGIYLGFGYLIFKTMIIGPGDIFIAGALGACFGWKYILLIIAAAVAIQVLTFIPVFFQKLIQKKDYLTITEFIIFITIASGNYLYLKYIPKEIYAVNILITIVLITSGIVLSKRIIDTLPENLVALNEAMLNGEEIEEENKNELFHMPFGPALCCASLLFIFLH
ncbi:prepilin peptidase [bacterium]|nr:prepilin peptidase [bacterium]